MLTVATSSCKHWNQSVKQFNQKCKWGAMDSRGSSIVYDVWCICVRVCVWVYMPCRSANCNISCSKVSASFAYQIFIKRLHTLIWHKNTVFQTFLAHFYQTHSWTAPPFLPASFFVRMLLLSQFLSEAASFRLTTYFQMKSVYRNRKLYAKQNKLKL